MRNPKAALKTTQLARNRRELCTRKQLSSKGTQGIKKRGSWCGKMERRMEAEMADTARMFFIHVGRVRGLVVNKDAIIMI